MFIILHLMSMISLHSLIGENPVTRYMVLFWTRPSAQHRESPLPQSVEHGPTILDLSQRKKSIPDCNFRHRNDEPLLFIKVFQSFFDSH
jgi:hypothetical protein